MRRWPVVLAVLSVAAGAGCASTATPPEPSGPAGEPTAAERSPVALSVTAPTGDTRRATITLRGRVTAGSEVRAKGRRAVTVGRRFRARVGLHLGVNRIRVVAHKPGWRPARETVRVTRKPPLPPPPTPTPTVDPTPTPTPESSCDPSYEGACLDPDAADYDCEGGSGDGPEYTGTVRVVGDDHFDLDRDADGVACDA